VNDIFPRACRRKSEAPCYLFNDLVNQATLATDSIDSQSNPPTPTPSPPLRVDFD
jgi:hypothetical protein